MAQSDLPQAGKQRGSKIPIRVTYEAVGGNDMAAFYRLLDHLRDLGFKLARSNESSSLDRKNL
jgi:hypothetical protein